MTAAFGRPKRNTGPWSAGRILACKSPILDKDISSFLAVCMVGWESNYDVRERRAIIDSLPPAYRRYDIDDGGRLRCPTTAMFFQEDRYLKQAIKRFKSDVGDGYYDKTWQNQARKAMQERQEGKFDEYLQKHAEERFGDYGAEEGNKVDGVGGEVSSDGE